MVRNLKNKFINNIAVYRSKYNSESGKWSQVNMGDPIIHVAAVVHDDKNFRNIRQMNAVLQSKPLSPVKQVSNKKTMQMMIMLINSQ